MINDIVRGLHIYLGKPVIRGNQSAPRPPYPYIQYVPLVETLDEGTGNESQQGLELQNKMSISFTAFASNPNEAYLLAKKAHVWFKYVGYDYLVRNQIAVVDALTIETRDILEVNKYEYRQGFDIVIRFAEFLESDDNWIEFYTIRREE